MTPTATRAAYDIIFARFLMPKLTIEERLDQSLKRSKAGPYFTEQTTKGGSDDSKNRPC
jgi:hypothetical protein